MAETKEQWLDEKEVRRVSKSQSSFHPDERLYRLVYRLQNGTYSEPIELPMEQALSIARSYGITRSLPHDCPVDEQGAKYILRHAADNGFLESLSKGSKPQNNAAFGVIHAGASPRKPKYFPSLEDPKSLDISQETVDTLAFILSGIDPALRSDPQTLQSELTLKELASTPSSRIPADSYLQDDHWYVLFHLHQIRKEDFQRLWQEAKTQKKGQQATDIQKLAGKFEKFKIDDLGESLRDGSHAELFSSIRENSVEILLRNFQRARRKIHTFHELPVAKSKTDWLVKLHLRRPPAQEPHTTVPVSEEVRQRVREYVGQCLKLGRILRSPVLEQNVGREHLES